MIRFLLALLITILIGHGLSAQWSVGARFGGATGVSLKKYPVTDGLHLEIISAFNLDDDVEGFSLTILGEKFGALSSDGSLGAFLGGGGTVILGDEFYVGLNAILGFDWHIFERVGVQLDWMPTWIFVNESHFSPINAAITARWVFSGRVTPTTNQ